MLGGAAAIHQLFVGITVLMVNPLFIELRYVANCTLRTALSISVAVTGRGREEYPHSVG
jgi:hypothetical protein